MSTHGLWLSAAGMKVNELRQTLSANNLANAQTPGFKHDLAVVRQRRMESQASPGARRFTHPVLDGLAGGVNVQPTFQNFAQGPIEHTDRPLDVAIDGEGFFAVSNGDRTRYTRDGRFAVSASGELVLAAGDGQWRVLDEAGTRIVLDETAGSVSVSADGMVRQGRAAVSKLGLVTTDDLQTLRKVGQNLFETTEEMVPASPRLAPESIEGSNYDVMSGLASMIEASRAFQFNATMIRIQDELTGQVVSRVARPA